MWFGSNDSKDNGAFTALVAYSDGCAVQLFDTKGGTAGVQYLPYGVQSVPPNNSKAMAVDVSGRVCVLGVEGVLDKALQPGEIALYSAGGASIVLRNDGKVYINGRSIE